MTEATARRSLGGVEGGLALVVSVPRCLCAAVPAVAQCPDGTPPPCREARVTVAPASNSVGVLHFEGPTSAFWPRPGAEPPLRTAEGVI